MVSSASMALLKGSSKKGKPPPAVEEPDVDSGVTTAESGDIEVEIDDLDEIGLEELIKSEQIATPKNWAKLDLDAKKLWLNEKYGDGDAEAEVEVEEEVEKPTKTVTKGKAKTKTVAAEDLIVLTSKELENLKEEDAKALVTELREGGEFTFFKLGGVLSVIQSHNWYEPHASFREYIENEQNMEYRKALYYVRIYNELVDSEVSWDLVKHLGWTKLKEITGILTKKNVKALVKMAETQTTVQLIESVKAWKKKEAAKAANGSDDTEEGETEPTPEVTVKTFKVHADQKKTIDAALDKAKKASGTTVDTVALEFICLDYLAGGETKPLDKQLAGLDLEKAIAVFEKAFPQTSLEVTVEEEAEAA